MQAFRPFRVKKCSDPAPHQRRHFDLFVFVEWWQLRRMSVTFIGIRIIWGQRLEVKRKVRNDGKEWQNR